MKDICNKDKCTGCFACFNICSVEAITMEADDFGFLYPIINTEICVDCGLCKDICPVNKPLFKQIASTAIAAFSLNSGDRASSTSGGAASVFSQNVLKNGGIVYGCSGENANEIQHIRVSESEDLYKLKGSKYVQSKMGNCLKDVLKDLQDNKKVLFTGTPCQIAGLKNFLQKDYENLLTVDLVCHGVPSQQLLTDSMKSYSINNSEDINSILFRKKGTSKKEQKFGIYLYDKSKKNIFSNEFPNENYISGFLFGLFFRESCYDCTYSSIERCSDLTIADFWGFQQSADFSVNKHEGLSLILPSTEKGRLFFDACKDDFQWTTRSVEEAENGNGQLQTPSSKNKNFNLFKELYPKNGFQKSCEICLKEDRKNHKKQENKQKIRFFLSKIPFAKSIYRLIKRA